MTKNTTGNVKRKGRKKNLKLRRSIQRTIAAIFMIMAVVVAAIPVEHLGTMQAKTDKKTGVVMEELYTAYRTNMLRAGSTAGKTIEDEYLLSHVTDNSIKDFLDYAPQKDGADYKTLMLTQSGNEYDMNYEFYVDDRTSGTGRAAGADTVIVGYEASKNSSSSVTIDDKLYTDYFVITQNYIDAVRTALTSEKYGVEFRTEALVNNTFTLNAEGGSTVDITLPSRLLTTTPYSYINTRQTGSISADSQSYTYVDGLNTNFTDEEIISQYVQNDFTNHLNSISSYNTDLQALATELNSLAASASVDAETLARVRETATTLRGRYDTFKEFSKTFAEMDTLPGFLESCIASRFYVSSSFSLVGFELSTLNDYTDKNGVLIPKWKRTNTAATPAEEVKRADNDRETRSSYIDEDGFIGLKSVTVSGIGNEAFAGITSITDVDLTEGIDFIGNAAFKNCGSLATANLLYVKAIGNEAFSGCGNLREVNFTDVDGATKPSSVMGAEAFYNCGSLQTVAFPNTLMGVGRGCFAKSGLRSFDIDDTSTHDIDICPFAFYDCVFLTNPGDGTTSDSFFPGENFSSNIKIGLGAFAVSAGNRGDGMDTFTFPQSMKQIIYEDDAYMLADTFASYFGSGNYSQETYYDYILAGRSALNRVVLPERLGTLTANITKKVPDNILMGCSNLECFVFGELSFAGACRDVYYDVPTPAGESDANFDTDGDGETLFQDITNTAFYVEGPGFVNSSNLADEATPRKITWAAQTAINDYVPYMFLNSDNPNDKRIEMSTGDNNQYLAVLQVIDDANKYAKLVEYKYRDEGATENIKDLVVPARIGEYRITELGSGCFEKIKDKVLELIIEDGSVSVLEANAFSGCTELQRVFLGNSVTTIGAGAFSGCSSLENVYFSSPMAVNSISNSSTSAEWASVLTIGTDAFKTRSTYLTFHGDIHSGYAPFDLAMSDFQFGSVANRRICYKTDSPSQLTVIRDNATGYATLIDYPHYDEIDVYQTELIRDIVQAGLANSLDADQYKITEKFEEVNGWTATSKYAGLTLSADELAVVAATYRLQLPDGIQSVNARAYFKDGSNSTNENYLYLTYTENSAGIISRSDSSSWRCVNAGSGYSNVVKIYSDDNYGSDVSQSGLFSGYYIEDGKGVVPKALSTKDYNGIAMHTEDKTAGNDQLMYVELSSVEYLPDYAFDSCENLLSVSLGSGMADMGVAPFSRCASLTSIEGNDYYICKNGLIYETGSSLTRAANGYTIVQCLMPRGNLVSSKSVNASVDENLRQTTAITKEAFAYCPYIQTVNLSESSVEAIPEACFRGATALTEVVLPRTVSSIGSKAFSETNSPTVYITNPTCQIESDAFDNGVGKIVGYRYSDSTNTNPSTAYQYAQNHGIEFEEITAEYFLTFLDYDGSLIETQTVENGKDGVAPTWTPSRTGYAFKEWSWEKNNTDGSKTLVTGDSVYRNVTENRIIVATYEVGSGIVSDGRDYTLTITNGKNAQGSSSITLKGGTALSVIANDPATGQTFQYWSESTNTYQELFEDLHSATTTFIMPNANVTIAANFTTGSGTTNNNSGTNNNTNNNNNTTDTDTTTETTYALTVNYGSGSGNYAAGTVVTIAALAPDSSTRVFSRWSTTNTGVGFASATSTQTTFVMPAAAVTVTANYRTRSLDEDEEDSDSSTSRRPQTTTTSTANVNTTTTNATTTTTSTNTTGTTNASTSTQSDRVTVNSNGISNTNLASANVEGATDNFVVKIGDSETAVTQAQQALINAFGSLDGIVYYPMDISLYDVTGNNEIADTTGLDVTVTVPIPDEMIQYGGNTRMAAIENGQLQNLNVRFTTIDGIACMSFTAPHFSPYVAYVDTNNLVAGQMLDATPKTGDPIHPKWFLAMGLACLSILLFMSNTKTSYQRKPAKHAA